MAFSSLGKLLPGAARRAGIGRDLAITTAIRAAQDALATVFGSEYSKFAEPIAVQNDGALVIACRSPAVAQTIRLKQERILRCAQAASPNIRIERVFLVPRSREDVRRRDDCGRQDNGGTMEQA